jgi:hypothetical protein
VLAPELDLEIAAEVVGDGTDATRDLAGKLLEGAEALGRS